MVSGGWEKILYIVRFGVNISSVFLDGPDTSDACFNNFFGSAFQSFWLWCLQVYTGDTILHGFFVSCGGPLRNFVVRSRYSVSPLGMPFSMGLGNILAPFLLYGDFGRSLKPQLFQGFGHAPAEASCYVLFNIGFDFRLAIAIYIDNIKILCRTRLAAL